jgi:hypothetical protein
MLPPDCCPARGNLSDCRSSSTGTIPTRRTVEPASPPAWVKPQLAKLVEKAPDGPDWLHEIKLDGYRMHARLDAGRVQILTRRWNDWTDKYPAIAKSIAGLPAQNAYLDGELCGGAARWQDGFQPYPERDRYRRGIAGLFPVRPAVPRWREPDGSAVDRAQDAVGIFQKLTCGEWIDTHDNLILRGPTGVGKSWLACKLSTIEPYC